MFEWIKEDMDKVSSSQYKFSLFMGVFCLAFALIAFISLSVYFFCKYAGDITWWIGFIPLGVALLFCLSLGSVIYLLYKRYKRALQLEREKDQKELNSETNN